MPLRRTHHGGPLPLPNRPQAAWSKIALALGCMCQAITEALLLQATIVLTDSGGVQEEAPSLGNPVLVMRDTTERPEAVSAGTARLVGTDADRVYSAVYRLLTSTSAYQAMANAVNPYGDGLAARRAVGAIEHMFGLGSAPDPVDPGDLIGGSAATCVQRIGAAGHAG